MSLNLFTIINNYFNFIFLNFTIFNFTTFNFTFFNFKTFYLTLSNFTSLALPSIINLVLLQQILFNLYFKSIIYIFYNRQSFVSYFTKSSLTTSHHQFSSFYKTILPCPLSFQYKTARVAMRRELRRKKRKIPQYKVFHPEST